MYVLTWLIYVFMYYRYVAAHHQMLTLTTLSRILKSMFDLIQCVMMHCIAIAVMPSMALQYMNGMEIKHRACAILLYMNI